MEGWAANAALGDPTMGDDVITPLIVRRELARIFDGLPIFKRTRDAAL